MKKLILLRFLFYTAIPYYLNAQELPQLRNEGNINRLYVDGKPFIMVAGELHNSTEGQIIPPQPGPDQPALESGKNTEVQTPAVYKVITYEMK